MADFQVHLKDFGQEDVGVLALSVDSPEKATETVEELNLTFPVAYGLEAPRDAERIGAFWEDERQLKPSSIADMVKVGNFWRERQGVIQPTGFLLDSERKVVDACYSIGPIGRVSPEEALLRVQGLKRMRRAG